MTRMLLDLALSTAVGVCSMVASAQSIVFSGVSNTSDGYQLGVVWSGIARGSPPPAWGSS